MPSTRKSMRPSIAADSSRAASGATATASALTTEQRSHLHRRLLDERSTITRRLARYGPNGDREDSISNRVPLHMADVGSDTMQESLEAAFASRDSRTLAEIDSALRRLYRTPADFGRDEHTGACIAFERLDIIPWARRAS